MALQSCQFCRCHEKQEIWVSNSILLSSVHHGIISGCPWCKLLSDGTLFFENRWSHLTDLEKSQVHLLMERALTSSRTQLCLRWPSKRPPDPFIEYLKGTVRVTIMSKLSLSLNKLRHWFLIIQLPNGPLSNKQQANMWMPWSFLYAPTSVHENSSSDECVELIKTWMHKCDSEHEQCRTPSSINGPKRLLQIKMDTSPYSVQLVSSGGIETERYTALSHCWGGSTGHETTCENLHSRMKFGLNVCDLPKSFQDAITITYNPDIRYIWIDSICINQEGMKEWESECLEMGSIYGHAYLVIAATLAANSHCGIYGQRQLHQIQLNWRQQKIDATVREAIDHTVWYKDEPSWQIFDDSGLPLFMRAWAFQERLLARRIVHFTPREIVWECRSTSYCECGTMNRLSLEKHQGWKSKSFKARYAQVTEWGSNIDRYELWGAIIDQFQSKGITKSSDRLPALISIARQVNKSGIMGRYLAGMWETSLPETLMWWCDSESAMLRHRQPATHRRVHSSQIPSWSWLSIEGPVNTWGRNFHSLVEILQIDYQLAGGDPYGPCQKASIMVRGYVVPVHLHKEPTKASAQRYRISIESEEQNAVLIPDTNPFEVQSHGLESLALLAFVFNKHEIANCLILLQAESASNKFRRIGIAEFAIGPLRRCIIQHIELV